jgi:putative transposase
MGISGEGLFLLSTQTKEFQWLRSRLPTLWTNSYFVATVGGAPRASIKQYIEQQKHV